MKIEHFIASTAAGKCRISYTRWGEADAERTVLCLHGLTRNGRDFDFLAKQLATRWQVVCPDMPGRGSSESLDHAEDYQYPTYLQICTALIEHLGLNSVDWVGTSMGGLLGMMLAAQDKSPIERLILNDIGAFIPGRALRFIGEYVGKTGPFTTMADLEKYLRLIHSGFGNLSDDQWQHLAQHSHWIDAQNRFWLAYDPKIAHPFRDTEIGDVDLWDIWGQVKCPTLLIRGERSEILPASIAKEMVSRPQTEMITLPNVGHAPSLMDEEQIKLVENWLLRT
ncbi:MAG: alpha/beta hydrolase [Gammaproteobacteria bacterium]